MGSTFSGKNKEPKPSAVHEAFAIKFAIEPVSTITITEWIEAGTSHSTFNS